MSVESVAQVEGDLGFGPLDAEVLKGVRLIWQKLLKLRQQALKDEKYLSQYRDLLSKGIAQARAQLPPEDDEALIEQSRQFWNWYELQCLDLNIHEKEALRGRPHQAWMEKFYPEQYKAFAEAIGRVVDNPSQQHYDGAKAEASALLRAYLGAITDS